MEHICCKSCLDNSDWNGYTLQCPCGKQIAIRYMINDEVRIFCYGKFARYKQEIIERKNPEKITSRADLFGYLGNEEWDELLCDIRQSKADT